MAPLVEVRAYFLLIRPVRLVLGLLGLAAARALQSHGVRPFALPGQGRELFVRAAG